MRLVGLIVAISCLLAAPQLRAESMNHGWDEGNHARMRHQDGRHYDHYQNGGHDGYNVDEEYAYGTPPMVYAPAPAPGISLFIPLRLR
ncbi:hypothetical protein QZM18_04220 [Burkholderia diffusa]|uniref:hypothetical protein n=1 Tax=Burkholderia diffusa TaxID=488732 RepID=UPI00264CBB17|nr:hypothetical protein [Burkholderia diffusa]MDN7903334.1 hypothetical protein [Burkholderia diffusa]